MTYGRDGIESLVITADHIAEVNAVFDAIEANMTPSERYWQAVADGADRDTLDELNTLRFEYEQRQTRERQLIDGHKVAILSVHCGMETYETADV